MTENKQVLEERDKTDNDNLQSETVVQKSEIIFSEFVLFFFFQCSYSDMFCTRKAR